MGNLTMVRWMRAAALSLLVVASTLAAHVSGGGALPGLPMLAPVCGLVVLTAAALLDRPLTWWWSGALLLAGQTALHGALQLLPVPTATAGAGGAGGHAAGGVGPHAGPVAGDAALGALTSWSADARMVVAHVVVALLVGAWLAAGERALWSLVALAAGSMTVTWLRLRRVLLIAVGPVVVLPRRRLTAWASVPVPVWIDAGSTVTRRGPPTGDCARSH